MIAYAVEARDSGLGWRDAVVVDWTEAEALMAAAPPAPRPGMERGYRYGVLVQALLDAGAPEWVSWVTQDLYDSHGRLTMVWLAPDA